MNKIILLSLITLVSSCDFLWNFFEPEFNIKEKDYVAGVVDGDPEPPYATPKMSKSSLLGIDKDNDGVRDDIEIWINRNVDEAKIRQYFKVYVKRQVSFLNCSDNDKCSQELKVLMRNTTCVFIIETKHWPEKRITQLEKVVDSLFFNTPDRKLKKNVREKSYEVDSFKIADNLGSFILSSQFCGFNVDWDEHKTKSIFSYSNRVTFVRKVREGFYEKYFNLDVNIKDYPNICDGFDGPNESLCN